jgi:hypothetical protein
MQFDRTAFFQDYRGRFGASKLSQAQVDGLSFLLDQFALDPGFTMVRQLAYVLATVRGETTTFQPRRELRAAAGKNPAIFKLQEKYWHTGFFGRGYVQITWQKNYRHAGVKLAGLNLFVTGPHGHEQALTIEPESFVKNPALVQQPRIAYLIMARGMREGWFTGKKLDDYIKEGQPPDYLNARRIINGLNRAAEFAGFADKFELILRAAKLA